MTRPISTHLSIVSGRRPQGRTNRSTSRARSNRPIFVPSRKRKGPARSGGGGEPEASCLVSIDDKGLVVKELCPVATIAQRARLDASRRLGYSLLETSYVCAPSTRSWPPCLSALLPLSKHGRPRRKRPPSGSSCWRASSSLPIPAGRWLWCVDQGEVTRAR